MPNELVISVVDDDPSVLEGTMDLLNSMGFIAETFPSAQEFLKSERLHCTSCLITDVQMPGMTGIELHDHLVRSGMVIPTILITAYPDDADRARAQQAGVCYITKPFDECQLLACIQFAITH